MAEINTVRNIPLSSLCASPTQPRKHFNEESLATLAESIRESGVHHPISVRVAPDLLAGNSDVEFFEIIFGERRYRASALAGLAEIPCIVRDWSDRKVVEEQMVENLQRIDLDPLEESEGYSAMLSFQDESGTPFDSIEKIAARVKKHPTYIYNRLKLRDLPTLARTALLGEVIGTEVSGIIARIPGEKQREEAAVRIIKPDFQDAPLSKRQASELVQRDYMRQLKNAPFDMEDASLVPSQGACGPCPYRSGNAKMGFGEMSGHLCTLPECFRLKTDATWTRAQEEAKHSEKRVLSAQESEKLFPDDGPKLDWTSEYVRIADQPPSDLVVRTTKRLPTWKHLLAKSPAKVEILVARSPRGHVVEIALRSAALEAARQVEPEMFIAPRGQAAPAVASHTLPSGNPRAENTPSGPSAAEIEAAKQKAERQKTRLDLAVLKAVLAATVAAVEEDGAEPANCFWTALLPLAIAHAGPEARKFVAERRGIDLTLIEGDPTEVAEMLEGEFCFAQLPALITEMLLGQYVRWQGGETSPYLAPFLKAYEIDAAQIRRDIEAKQKQPKQDPQKPDANTI